MAAAFRATKGAAGAHAVAVQGAGDEFLAGAGFAGDEDGDLGLGQAADGAKDFLHGGG